ncbi:YukJ family protein [Alicyclobacillus sp. SO9]|uniref:YukJ family protein n=1 Tax=Alicyclobacillus sp. SO9 TaxID=2665646 RepID=UPI0018E8DD99|nr:YukJ family protein [Alicyclobacillus sp. SO9]QQE80661.1 YukJ family protein [Alicyclobacillus sp. SO9]
MPILNYGVVCGRVVRYSPGSDSFSHFQIILVDDSHTEYQVDVNVRSKDGSEVLYFSTDNFTRDLIQDWKGLSTGFTPLQSNADSGALDYLREDLFAVESMQPLPMKGPANDALNAYLGQAIKKAYDENGLVYAFGQHFRDRGHSARHDKRFHEPSRGIHDIHMNQGNLSRYEKENGPYQDGGLFVEDKSRGQWTAIFLAFQTQSFRTDASGDPTGPTWASEHGGEVR